MIIIITIIIIIIILIIIIIINKNSIPSVPGNKFFLPTYLWFTNQPSIIQRIIY